MSTLVCFALQQEAAPFRKIATGKPGVSILIVGVGRQNARQAIEDFLANGRSEPPKLVFTCGFAGGLNPDLKIGDVVFETANAPSAITDQLTKAGAKPARFFCADRIATTVDEKKKLRQETGADVVEMESAAIQAVCLASGIPCVTLRAVSDPAGEALPLDFNALSKPDKNLDFGKLAWTIAKSPGKIGALLALQKKTGHAANRLAAVLTKVALP